MGFEIWRNLSLDYLPSSASFSSSIIKYLSPGKFVLDVGCGRGRICKMAKSLGCETYGIDINEEAISHARLDKGLAGVNLSVQDVKNLSFEDNYFDCVISLAVLGCMGKTERAKTLNEIVRVMKSGGHFHLSEFGLNEETDRYKSDEKLTDEYGTVIVHNKDGSVRFQTHNFSQLELENLLTNAGLSVVSYENPWFTSFNEHLHPGHIYIAKK